MVTGSNGINPPKRKGRLDRAASLSQYRLPRRDFIPIDADAEGPRARGGHRRLDDEALAGARENERLLAGGLAEHCRIAQGRGEGRVRNDGEQRTERVRVERAR